MEKKKETAKQAAGAPKAKCGAKKKQGPGTCQNPAGFKTDHPGEGPCHLHGGATPIKHGIRSRYRHINRPRIRELLEALESEDDPLDLLPEVHLLRALILDYVERYDAYTEALLAWHSSFGPDYQKAVDAWAAEWARWEGRWKDWAAEWAAYREDVETVQRFYAAGWPEPPEVPPLDAVVAEIPAPPPSPVLFERKPRQVVDVLAAGKYIGEIGALIERMHKMREEGAVSLAMLKDVLQRFGVEMAQGVMETVPDDALRTAVLEAVEKRWSGITLAGIGGGRRGAG